MDRFSVYAVVSAIQAMQDAGLKEGSFDPERCGVILGNGIGGIETLGDNFKKLFDRGPKAIHPLCSPMMIANIAPGNIAIKLNLQGPCLTVVTACASGTDAIGDAMRLIREGRVDLMLAGGTEATVTPLGLASFCVLQAVSTKFNDTPEKASRPFDAARDGFVMGEGAGILVLEELEHARKRGARIYAEVAGYGCTCDANHLTAPHPEGRGAVKAMRLAVEDAGLKPEDIDYINAHGTSTPVNDPVETKAIKDRVRRARPQAQGVLHQVHDRAPAGRGRWGGGHRDGAGPARAVLPGHPQLRDPRPGLRPGLRAQQGLQRPHARGHLQLLRLRRAQRGGLLQALGVALAGGGAL